MELLTEYLTLEYPQLLQPVAEEKQIDIKEWVNSEWPTYHLQEA